MFGTDSAKWKEIFGGSWKRIEEACPEIGGFIVFHKDEEVVMDSNARKLARMDKLPAYREMLDFLSGLPLYLEDGARLILQVFDTDDSYTAGILVKRQFQLSEWERYSVLPVCDASRLIVEIARNKATALLALIKLDTPNDCQSSEYHTLSVLTEIIAFSPEGTLLSLHSSNCFWLYIPDFNRDPAEYLSEMQKRVKDAAAKENALNARFPDQGAGFSAGVGARDASPAEKMQTAEFALYEAELMGGASIVCYSDKQYESRRGEYKKMSRFMRLVNDNLFLYHFQPIVSARNGEIVAYEMLMRSGSDINMSPLEILECAEKARRLYDIEKATMKNALSIIGRSQEMLESRKLFVNSITAHMLTDDDWSVLENEYEELMEKMVIELTEQTELDSQSIDAIRTRLARRNIKIAIDDFGTGYSNTSNLIRYNPDYVKIDRMLIDGINSKPKVRKLVLGIVEFIHENGYKALAEGVETYDELKTVIQLGCDLIQGYYVSKPKPIMLLNTSERIVREITKINLENPGGVSVVYTPEEGEDVDLCRIATEGYNSVMVDKENVSLIGRPNVSLDMGIRVKSGVKTVISLENVFIKNAKDAPVIDLGDGCEVDLLIKGVNVLDGKGIYVPQKTDLHITGGGELTVIANRQNCFAIGTDIENNPGNIFVEFGGKLFIEANGDNSVGIGGGKNHAANVIRITGGELGVKCSGRYCLGIGIAEGGSIIDMENNCCSISASAPDTVGIGSFKGNTDLQLKNFRLTEKLSGINIAGIGTISGGTGRIIITDGRIESTLNGRTVNSIGTRNGNLDCRVFHSSLTLYCECASVSGVGDMNGGGNVTLEDSSLHFKFLTGDGLAYGSKSGEVKCINTKESISINA